MSEKFPIHKETEGLPEGGANVETLKSEKPKRRKAPKLSDAAEDVVIKKPKEFKSFAEIEIDGLEKPKPKKEKLEDITSEEFSDLVIENNVNELIIDEVSETIPEEVVEKKKGNLRKQGEIVLDRFKKAEAEALAKENRKKSFEERKTKKEDVSSRVGGSSFRQKAVDAIKKAEKEDQMRPIFERQENTTKNRKFDERSRPIRKYQRIKEEKNLKIIRDKLRGVSVSSLPDAGEIENTNFSKKTSQKEEKKYKDISTEPPAIDFYENEYDPSASSEVALPDISSINGKELGFEGKVLKTAKEKSMEQTQEFADVYHENKLKRKDVLKAKSIDELIEYISNSSGIEGQSGITFSAKDLVDAITGVQKGELSYEYITRSAGLRQKVFDLLENPAASELPPPLPEAEKKLPPPLPKSEKKLPPPLPEAEKKLPPPLPKIESEIPAPEESSKVPEESVVVLGQRPDISGRNRKATKKADKLKPEDLAIGKAKEPLFTVEKKNDGPLFNQEPVDSVYTREQFLKRDPIPVPPEAPKSSYLNEELSTIKTKKAEIKTETKTEPVEEPVTTIFEGKKRKSKALKEAEGNVELADVALRDIKNKLTVDSNLKPQPFRKFFRRILGLDKKRIEKISQAQKEADDAYVRAFEDLVSVVVEEELNRIIAPGYENIDMELTLVDLDKAGMLRKYPAISDYYKNSKGGYDSKISLKEIIEGPLQGKIITSEIQGLIKTKIRPGIRDRLVEERNEKNKSSVI